MGSERMSLGVRRGIIEWSWVGKLLKEYAEGKRNRGGVFVLEVRERVYTSFLRRFFSLYTVFVLLTPLWAALSDRRCFNSLCYIDYR